MNYFKRSEFDCKCGKCGYGYDDVNGMAMSRLLQARALAEVIGSGKVKFIINSAVRCQRHNVAVGGVLTSSHLDGFAFDIGIKNSYERFIIVKSLIQAGFPRLKLYKDFVHADLSPYKKAEVLML